MVRERRMSVSPFHCLGGDHMARSRNSESANKVRTVRASKPFCSTPPHLTPQLPDSVAANPPRARAMLEARSKWANRTLLHYCFFTGSSEYAVPKVQAD